MLSNDPSLETNIVLGTAKAVAVSKKTNLILNAVPCTQGDKDMNEIVESKNSVIHQTVNVTQKCSENIVLNFLPERLDYTCFSRSGIHLNRKGKHLYCERLCTLIKNKELKVPSKTESSSTSDFLG